MTDFIVCGWYTPDYEPHAARFSASLRERGVPQDLLEAPKPSNAGWERVTRLKPVMARHFMDCYFPHKVIILSDVDSICEASPEYLTTFDCDIACKLSVKGRYGSRFLKPRASVLVLYQTPVTVTLVENWARSCARAGYGLTDEDCLAEAIAHTPALRIQSLEGIADPYFSHSSASMRMPFMKLRKASNLKRSLHWAAEAVKKKLGGRDDR